MKALILCLALVTGLFHLPSSAAPQSFSAAKVEARQHVYFDRNESAEGTLYCGCTWRWTGKSGGRVNLQSCSYTPRKNATRAERIEWEHIVPAWVMGHQRQCWQNGGRKNCNSNDPVFRAMEADLHNLSPVIGEVNGDRSNHLYGMVSRDMPNQYGQCSTRTDFKQRTNEPRDAAKGIAARVTFYMYDRYGLSMSRQQQRVLMAWDRQFPVSSWERERDQRIARIMGHHNPFVTGERTWSLGHKPSREGVENAATTETNRVRSPIIVENSTGAIIGNRNSRVYHLPQGCPSYGQVAQRNRVPFTSEAEARAAGYRRAGNCQSNLTD